MTYDLIIIGAGAAGISSAIYAGSRRLNLLVFEQEAVGGLINKVSIISHFEGVNLGEPGSDFINRAKRQLNQQHVNVLKEKVTAVDLSGDLKKVTTTNSIYEAKAVIIAAGSVPNIVPFDGRETLEGNHVFYEVNEKNLDQIRGKDIFVVGGSDGATKEAIYLSDFAAKVNLVYVEDKIGAVKEFQELLSDKKNIVQHPHSSIVKAERVQDRLVVGIRDNNSQHVKTFEAENGAIFVFAGIKPNSKLFEGMLDMENGFIKTDENMRTNIPNVFAIGDIRVKKVRQVSLAVAEGTIAAIVASQSI